MVSPGLVAPVGDGPCCLPLCLGGGGFSLSLRKAALEASGQHSPQAPHSDPGPGGGERAGEIRSAPEERTVAYYIWTAAASFSGELGLLGGLGGVGMAI